MSNPNPQNQFKKGHPPVSPGRPPKDWTWKELLKESLEEIEPESGLEYRKLVSKSLRLKAMEGDVQAIKEFGNRIDGLPPQSVDVTSKGEQVFSGADYIGEHNSKTDTTTA